MICIDTREEGRRLCREQCRQSTVDRWRLSNNPIHQFGVPNLFVSIYYVLCIM